MRLAININGLPPGLNTGTLERVNFHYLPTVWPMDASAAVVRQAFSNGVDPDAHVGPFCLDIEPTPRNAKEFETAINRHVSARQRTRAVFPGKELWAYDPAGDLDLQELRDNILASRSGIDGFDAAGSSGYYATAAGGFDESRAAALTSAYIAVCKRRCNPAVDVAGFAAIRNNGHAPAMPVDLWRKVIQCAEDHGCDIFCLWNDETQHLPPEKARAVLQPYVDCLLEAA